MNRLQSVFFVLGSFCVLTPLSYGEAGPVEKPVYGVLDMQAVILNVEEGKRERKKLEKEIKAKEAEYKKKQAELERLNKELIQNAALLSDSAKLKKQQELQEKVVGFRNEEVTFKAEIKRKEQKATQTIAVKVAKIVEKMAKERRLKIVFESNSSGLLYVQNPVDLTPEVIKVYNNGGGKKKINDPITSAKK